MVSILGKYSQLIVSLIYFLEVKRAPACNLNGLGATRCNESAVCEKDADALGASCGHRKALQAVCVDIRSCSQLIRQQGLHLLGPLCLTVTGIEL